jgi:hypothetical protein
MAFRNNRPTEVGFAKSRLGSAFRGFPGAFDGRDLFLPIKVEAVLTRSFAYCARPKSQSRVRTMARPKARLPMLTPRSQMAGASSKIDWRVGLDGS